MGRPGNQKERDLDCKKNLVKQRFGHRLNPEQWQAVEEAVTDIHKMAVALRAVDIRNSDEPCTTFVPRRNRD